MSLFNKNLRNKTLSRKGKITALQQVLSDPYLDAKDEVEAVKRLGYLYEQLCMEITEEVIMQGGEFPVSVVVRNTYKDVPCVSLIYFNEGDLKLMQSSFRYYSEDDCDCENCKLAKDLGLSFPKPNPDNFN